MRGVEHEETDLGFLGAAQGTAQALLLDKIVALAQARGVGEQHRIAREVDCDFDNVAGRAGDRRGDRRLAPGDAVQEARLAGVRRPEDRDRNAVAQSLAAPAVGEMTLDLGEERGGLAGNTGLDLGRQVFVGEVDYGFEMGERAGQAPAPDAVEGAEFAVELAQGLMALRLGFGGDKIGDRLGLGQVELAVEEGASGEFAGLGEPQAETAQHPRDRGQHRTAAVHVEFRDILAGGAPR